MPDTPVIDLQAIEVLRSLNPDDNGEFLKEIVGIFLEDTPQRIAELDDSLAAADVAKFVRAAHSIKGSSANLGAMVLRGAAERLEHHSKQNGLSNTGPLIADLKLEYQRAAKEIRAIVNS